MMIKLANKLAARTLVVWLESTTAPETMTNASPVVSAITSANKVKDGAQPLKKYSPVR